MIQSVGFIVNNKGDIAIPSSHVRPSSETELFPIPLRSYNFLKMGSFSLPYDSPYIELIMSNDFLFGDKTLTFIFMYKYNNIRHIYVNYKSLNNTLKSALADLRISDNLLILLLGNHSLIHKIVKLSLCIQAKAEKLIQLFKHSYTSKSVSVISAV